MVKNLARDTNFNQFANLSESLIFKKLWHTKSGHGSVILDQLTQIFLQRKAKSYLFVIQGNVERALLILGQNFEIKLKE